jgi:hypothetical protein
LLVLAILAIFPIEQQTNPWIIVQQCCCAWRWNIR